MSYREEGGGLEAALELPEAASLVVLAIGPDGAASLMMLDQSAARRLRQGLHRLSLPALPAPTGTRFIRHDFGGPAAAAGVQCASVQVRNGMIVTGTGFDRIFCGQTGLTTNPYTGTPSQPAVTADGAFRSRQDASGLVLLAFTGRIGTRELEEIASRVVLAPGAPAEEAVMQVFRDRPGYWALLRPGDRGDP